MPEHPGQAITILKVTPWEEAGVVVTSSARSPDGRLADVHSGYHDNLSPPLAWSDVPGARAWALIVEDPDAPRETPFVHWMIWNIPGQARALPAGIPPRDYPGTPQNAVQGRNDMGQYGWFGPRPPPGHGVHHYHFQLFALDEAIPLAPDTPLHELLNALKGHTLAQGEMVATYEAPRQQ
ncbi:MAG: YbhB/YbcL family Raf kinase inhibitor-like protein [Phenylobacterium sp.]